ncbi:MAG: hypothetical protein OSB10_00940 [Planctomycetota bacterium]|nr:hypothetical protein [Planctomycetota bacterium]
MTTETPAPITDWIQTAWSDHAGDPEAVMNRSDKGMALVTEAKDLAPLATLIAHVAANHLGRYEDGLAFMDKLSALDVFAAGDPDSMTVTRCKAILHMCLGNDEKATAFEDAGHPAELPRASTSVRVRMAVASALGEQGQPERSRALYKEAIALASYGPKEGDPAASALAMNSNNMACDLEERENRSAEDDALLELASKTARIYWEIAGSWVQIKLAEYRLAMTFIALGNGELATEHANLALAICEDNFGSDEDFFFPYEALARARFCEGDKDGANEARDKMANALEEASDGNRDWFTGSLADLDKHLA